MRSGLFVLLFVVLTSCGSNKKASETTSEASAEPPVETGAEEGTNNDKIQPAVSTEGVIVDKSAEEGCGFMIKVVAILFILN